MTRILVAFFVLIILASSFCCSQSQPFNMNLDQQAAAWTPCSYLNQCNPGGTGTPTSVLIQGSSTGLLLSVTGGAFTNFLAIDKVGATAATYFHAETWATPSVTPYTGEYEFDIGVTVAPYEYMFGTQCVVGGVWDIFDQLHNTWVPTTFPCKFDQGVGHYYQLWGHYLPGDVSCSGYPRQYFDMIGVDYIYYSPANYVECAGPIPTSWANNSWFQVQLDTNGSAPANTTISETLRYTNFVEIASPFVLPPTGLSVVVNQVKQ